MRTLTVAAVAFLISAAAAFLAATVVLWISASAHAADDVTWKPYAEPICAATAADLLASPALMEHGRSKIVAHAGDEYTIRWNSGAEHVARLNLRDDGSLCFATYAVMGQRT